MNEFDIYHTIRSQISRGVVGAVYDNGPEQLVDLNVHAGQVRTRIPVHQPFGFSSHAPIDGAITHLVSTGADPADLVALPPSNPAAARMGNLKEGETVLYDAAGQRLIFRNGIIAEVDVVNEFIVQVKGKEILKLNNKGISITGNVTVSGSIKAGENITASKNITADENITALMNIMAGENITALKNITADENITALKNIKAGKNITASKNIKAGGDIKANVSV